MAKHHHKAEDYLRQLKSLQHQQQAFHSELDNRLRLMDDQMFNLIQGQQFYQQSLVALTLMECTPESWLTGSQVVEQRLRNHPPQLTLADFMVPFPHLWESQRKKFQMSD